MVYQTSVLNGYPLTGVLPHLLSLAVFILLPIPVLGKIKNAMLKYVYIP